MAGGNELLIIIYSYASKQQLLTCQYQQNYLPLHLLVNVLAWGVARFFFLNRMNDKKLDKREMGWE